MQKKTLYVRLKGIPEGGLKSLQTKGPMSFLRKQESVSSKPS